MKVAYQLIVKVIIQFIFQIVFIVFEKSDPIFEIRQKFPVRAPFLSHHSSLRIFVEQGQVEVVIPVIIFRDYLCLEQKLFIECLGQSIFAMLLDKNPVSQVPFIVWILFFQNVLKSQDAFSPLKILDIVYERINLAFLSIS